MLEFSLLPVEALVFRSELVCICTFRCPAGHPLFADSGPSSVPTFVFPRTHTYIRHAGRDAFLGGPDRVSFYNRGQEYRRTPASEEGDHSDWYVVAPEVLTEIVRRHDREAGDGHGEGRPFAFAYGPSDMATYILQRRAFTHARSWSRPDTLFIEEAILTALDRAIGSACRASGRRARRPETDTAGRHRELAEHARFVLSRRFAEQLSLPALARETGSSVFHLCRVFRQQTGGSLHRHREQLRLRAALDRLESKAALTDVALELGYASHSHFTMAFRKMFGVTPSGYRDELGIASVGS